MDPTTPCTCGHDFDEHIDGGVCVAGECDCFLFEEEESDGD